MTKKLINQDPFSNGTEHMAFETYNCKKCIKSSEPRYDTKYDGLTWYTNRGEDGLPKCSIQRDIVTRMFNNDPIKEETVNICREFTLYGVLCPYIKTEYPKNKKTKKTDKNQTTLEL